MNDTRTDDPNDAMQARNREVAGHQANGEVAGQAKKPSVVREATPHDATERHRALIVLGVLVFTILLSLLVSKDKNLFVVGYIVAIVYVMSGPRRRNEPWAEVGIKPRAAFIEDLKKVWYLVPIVVLLFQLLPPEFGVAHLFGFYPQLLHHVHERVSKVPGLVGLALILTLFETIVYQVFTQERFSWFIGTAAAILVASVLAALAHAAEKSGSFQVVFTDSAGVTLDFIIFGIIWARTRNLALTWATHYATDLVGIVALTWIF